VAINVWRVVAYVYVRVLIVAFALGLDLLVVFSI
jgi:hypothetical protein